MLQVEIASKWNGRPSTVRERVMITLEDDGAAIKVHIDAPFHGDPPPDGEPGSTDGLWNHEVVELFIAGADGHYLELEFGPFGHHLALTFSSVRERSGGPHPIRFRTVVLKQNWIGTAWIPRDLLPDGPHRLNATAIHGHSKHRRHLSWQALPGSAPDFHQPDHFAPVVLP